MSEPIVWSADGFATVDGIPVRCDRVRVVGLLPTWFVMPAHEHEGPITVEHVSDRDLAARAVVAAVKVLRGEE